MSKEKVKQKALTFHPRRWIAVLVGIFFLVYIFGLIVAFRYGIEDRGDFFVNLFILILLGFFLWALMLEYFQARLTFYDDVLILTKGGSRLTIPYEMMERFEVRGSKSSRVGIAFIEKIQPEVKGLAERIFYGRKTNFISLDTYVSVPRAGFFRRKVNTEKFRETDIGQALYENAPHLFKEKKKDKWSM